MNQKQIARAAGVSTATVSRVVNNDKCVSPKTRAKVLEAIEQHAYVQNINARILRTKKSRTIGFLVSNFSNPFFIAVYSGLEPVCRKLGYNIIIGNTNEDIQQEIDALDVFLSYRVDGIIASFVLPSDATIAKLKSYDMNVVILDRRIKNLVSDTIAIDSISGAKEQVRYLAGLGHKKIAVIHGTGYDSPGIDRMEGFRQGMREAGLEVRKEYMACGEFLEKSSYIAAIGLMNLPDPPTAIITHNNLMCMGAYKALYDSKIRIPDDVSLLGFDGFGFAEHLQPSITYMDRPTSEMGDLAAKMLIDRIEKRYDGPVREVIFPVKLKIGGSCGAPKPSGAEK